MNQDFRESSEVSQSVLKRRTKSTLRALVYKGYWYLSRLPRLLCLICGVLLIVASPFFIFHTEATEYPYPAYSSSNVRGINPPLGIVYYNYNSYYIFFGMFLLASGIVFIIASYYRHGDGYDWQ
jgi:hypothetical protein